MLQISQPDISVAPADEFGGQCIRTADRLIGSGLQGKPLIVFGFFYL